MADAGNKASLAAASRVRKSRQNRNLQFSDGQLQISDEFPIWVLRILIVPKFPQNGGVQPQILHFWTTIFRQEKRFRQFSDSPKFRGGGGNCPLIPTCHDSTDHWSLPGVSNPDHFPSVKRRCQQPDNPLSIG